MVDPLISTGLATDWLKRLQKLWSSLRKTRADELEEIRNVFGDPEHLSRFYIEPDCQPVNPADHDEDESIRAFRQSVRPWLNRFLEKEFFERDGRNTVFILSDAGMGKSSLLMMLKLTHLLKFWPDGLDFRLMKLGPDTLEKLASIKDRSKTVLLLDSLDEDSTAWGRIEERLMELLDATKSFRQVILTCRTQFFPEGSAAPIEAPFKVVIRGYVCNLLYMSPFDNTQVEAYLRKVYPNRFRDLARRWLQKEDNPQLARARKVIEPMKSLRMRPMLLAHIDELLQSEVREWREFPVYKALVRRWLLREQVKQRGKYSEEQLWDVCEEVAISLQMSGKRVLSMQGLEEIQRRLPAAETLEAFDIGGRSLLNKTSDNGFRFSHYSVQEFLVAKRLVSGQWKGLSSPLRATDQLLSFLFSWVDDGTAENLARIPWRSLNFEDSHFRVNRSFEFEMTGAELPGVYLRGSRISGFLQEANLEGAWLEGATLRRLDLVGANLRRARLAGCRLSLVNLRYVDARDADFLGCSFDACHLSHGRFARSNFQAANLAGVSSSSGAGFLDAKGFPDQPEWLDQSAGPPAPRSLKPVLALNVERGSQVSASSSGGVAVLVGGKHSSLLDGPRSLGWPSCQGLLSVRIREESCVSLWRPSGRVSDEKLEPARVWGALAWTPDQERFFVVGVDGVIEQFSFDPLRRLKPPESLRAYKPAIGCYDQGIFSASIQADSGRFRIVIRDLDTGEEIVELAGHRHPINCLAWEPGRPVLASAALDGAVRIWRIRPRRRSESLESVRGQVVSLAWEATGTLLAAVLENGEVCIWHVDRGSYLPFQATLPLAAQLVWSPKGTRLALVGRSGEVLLWDVLDNRQILLPAQASAVAWHPEGKLLALAAPQGAIEIWDVEGSTPQLLLSLFDTSPVQGLAWTADGYVDGPPKSLEHVCFADGEALYDLSDLPERHDPERVRQAMSAVFGPTSSDPSHTPAESTYPRPAP